MPDEQSERGDIAKATPTVFAKRKGIKLVTDVLGGGGRPSVRGCVNVACARVGRKMSRAR